MHDTALQETAYQNINSILTQAFGEPSGTRALVVYDEQVPFTILITEAYKKCLPHAEFVSFDKTGPSKILERFTDLKAGDLVVLVQSTNFRLDEFRIRVLLFRQGLRVIEHPHLGNVAEDEKEIYVDSLKHDTAYFQHVGPTLKNIIDNASGLTVISGEHKLVFGGPLEEAKLNIGDYRGMKNVGGQFPIGEVFTELKDLTLLNGKVKIFAFGDKNFEVFDCLQDPVVMEIAQGKVVGVNRHLPQFDEILDEIKAHDGLIWVRELGLGINRALTVDRRIAKDVGIYERMCGVHLSLGSKHTVYSKVGFPKKRTKYHVDIFALADQVVVDDKIIYENRQYTI